MKHLSFFRTLLPSHPRPPRGRGQADATGFSYFKNDAAAIKLFAWIILRAEHVIIACLRTTSRLAVLGFALLTGTHYSDGFGKLISRLLSI